MNDGWAYRIDYPYYSWAETVVRPRIVRRDLREVIIRLNEREGNSPAKWIVDLSELASAAKFVDAEGRLGVSALTPDSVATELREGLAESRAAIG